MTIPSISVATATFCLAGALLYAIGPSIASKPVHPAKVTPASVIAGKALVSQYRCVGCHRPDLSGRPGMTPSIRKTGALHDYTAAQFVTLMHTGMKNDGSHVRPPMPTYAQMPSLQAKSIFLYLSSLK